MNENKIPRPWYVINNSTRVIGKEIRGACIFPSSDPSISDRVDHVNVAHCLFATWNLAHPLCASLNLSQPRAHSISLKARGVVRPDHEYEIALSIVKVRGREKVSGRAHVSILEGRRALFSATVQFFAKKV